MEEKKYRTNGFYCVVDDYGDSGSRYCNKRIKAG